MSQSKVAVVHPGTQHSWQTARALQDLNQLAFLATTIHYDPARWPYRLERLPLVGRKLHREFARFAIPGLDPDLVRTRGWHEWAERMAARAHMPTIARRIDAIGNRSFARTAARWSVDERVKAFWGYDNSSFEAFRALHGRGITRILDVTIAPRRALNRVMQDIASKWPDFVRPASHAVPETILTRADEEVALADAICVGSPFVRETLLAEAGDPALANRIHLLPYCYDELLFAGQPPPTRALPGEPVRFLFVGTIGPRKGAHLLLEAIMHIPARDASLTLVGSVDFPASTFARYANRIKHLPHVPRGDIPAIMAGHDVLVLPSYFEGSAITLLEGLASGLALIQSPNAGLGVTRETGLMLDELNVDALEQAMGEALADRERLLRWRTQAQVRAQDFTFERYRANIAALLEKLGLQT